MADTFVPTDGVASAAKRALQWIKDGKAGDGFTNTGRARASQLANRNAVSKDTINRMVSFFARHEVDKKAEGFNQGEKGFPSAGRVAWDAWGGDAGKSWAESVSSKFNKEKSTMATDFANSYAAIIKQEKQEDGSLLVYGKATDDSLDIDQQICDDTWLSSAMPEWFKTGGNIREQHSSIAAGVAKEYESKADGHYISVLVVDPISVKKVESGVLKGFSIGIKSPRVVRDQKAANGRIIDGQIVEVSLVDRPANPNAKLMLAKSVEGEANLVQVEELVETTTETKDKSMLAEVIKELQADSAKFDQASYDAARKGIAQLIISEASEIGDTDSDERDDIDTLLSALRHLFNFRDGEIDEDQEAGMAPMIQLAAMSDEMKEMHKDGGCAGCECDGCQLCDGCDSDNCKMCKCGYGMEKSATISKCLECGCHDVSNSHGLTQIPTPGKTDGTAVAANVTTAVIVTPEQNAGSVKSADAEDVVDAEVPVEDVKAEDAPAKDAPIVEEKTEEEITDILGEKFVTSIIEKAVKSASETVKAEIDSYKAAIKAADNKSVALESELVIAKSAAASGGPKRTGRVVVTDSNELLIKAAEYRLKAQATSDPILAKGYKALEKEFLSKAGTISEAE